MHIYFMLDELGTVDRDAVGRSDWHTVGRYSRRLVLMHIYSLLGTVDQFLRFLDA